MTSSTHRAERWLRAPLVALGLLALWVPAARADDAGPRYSLDEVQATLAVQGIDGWLLVGKGADNPVASELVHPAGPSTYQWFYLIPSSGKPRALVHVVDRSLFEDSGADVREYSSDGEERRGLRRLLRGTKQLAAEYLPSSKIASLNRVDVATAREIEKAGVTLISSANLVQFTKSLWGPDGRFAHYLAAHHLDRVRDKALRHLAREMAAGRTLTEYDLQQYALDELGPREVDGQVVVAAGESTADPSHAPTSGASAPIRRGDLLRIALHGHMQNAARPIAASVTWMAYAGSQVPSRYAEPFAKIVAARRAVVSLIRERLSRRRPVLGHEADAAARQVIMDAGLGDAYGERTGHSLDTSLEGDGANLQGGELKDTRALVRGSGFTIAPALYVEAQYGVATGVGAFIGKDGLEITSERQKSITPIFRSSSP